MCVWMFQQREAREQQEGGQEEYERQELERRKQRKAEEEIYRLQEAETTQAAETFWARAFFGFEAVGDDGCTTEDGTRNGLFSVFGYGVDSNPDEKFMKPNHQALPSAIVLYDYAAGEPNEISFEKGHTSSPILRRSVKSTEEKSSNRVIEKDDHLTSSKSHEKCINSGDKPYQCTFCNTMIQNTRTKTFKCLQPERNNNLFDFWTLTIHLRARTGENQFKYKFERCIKYFAKSPNM
ncbi:11411_t:CDS:10 [Diversispora eburnea]|uniref:11411_t:CDS:1 n=1 Tax=Diversispora eburnea TaxID=1213867 RepID=A0A9N8VMB8_9GLOM|nr:11411_t:CDS:10 [Diversispora eburnea]